MKVLGFICVLCVVLSCSSDDTTLENSTTEGNFYGLTVGNIWVYKHYQYNSNTETYSDTGVIDSVNVMATANINGHTYYQVKRKTSGNEANIPYLHSNGEQVEFLRDSLGYLITNDGWIKFTNNDYTERILNVDSWGTIYEKLTEEVSTITVEAGEFTSIHSERFARDSNEEQLPGLDTYHYVDGIGLVYNTCSAVTSDIPVIETRLDSYVVQ